VIETSPKPRCKRSGIAQTHPYTKYPSLSKASDCRYCSGHPVIICCNRSWLVMIMIYEQLKCFMGDGSTKVLLLAAVDDE